MTLTKYARILSVGVLAGALWLAAGAAPVPAAAEPTEIDFTAVDAYVRATMTQAPIPGLALGIVQGDQIVHLQGFGRADPSGRSVTPQTPFVIGSLSKTFTALAIRQLVNAGRIELDAPVQRYIPWFRVADPAASSRITLRQLLEHRSGISRAAGNVAYLLDPYASLEDLVRKCATVELFAPPGAATEYSNINFLVLGLVVQTVSGQPFGEYLQQHIFTPLGMRHTYVAEAPARAAGLAQGHQIWYGFPVPVQETYLPGQVSEGWIISSAEDLSHYLIPYLNGGRAGEVSVLLPAGAAMAPQAAPPAPWYEVYWYPHYGPAAGVVSGHSGETVSYSGGLELRPGPRWGVIVLMNSAPDILVPAVTAYEIATGVADRLEGRPAAAPTDHGFYLGYAWRDAACLALLGFVAFRGARLRTWRRALQRPGPRRLTGMALPIALDLGVAGGLLVAGPLLENRGWDFLLRVLPDVYVVVFGAALLLLALGLIKAGIALAVGRPARRPTGRAAPLLPGPVA